MGMGRHECNKPKTSPTYSKEWSGVSYAPHCKGRCGKCNTQLHHEAGSHYCPGCDDYVSRPDNCQKKQWDGYW